ncbi:hypothetical protein BBJ29_006482 [Phytophthora kernoviae]|uniref:SWIM-type domain-containing protein n=1 Tax=Phytophthora kernoviae TaxID=325452 RepID=A0A3F2S207_9STRA|nr:hypothetical protein BBP00_00000852 [Phytophthora kernoviae]RLN71594.1 hypothetical protein BBJ29_006482 [Phytophthora kernoviae]
MEPETNSAHDVSAPTLPRGMRFPDSKSALYAIQDYALYYNKKVKVGRRGGKHRRMIFAKPTERQLVASCHFQQALANAPNGTATQLKDQLQGDTNIRTIYRAKQNMKRQLLDQLGVSYRKIPSLLRSFSELNPQSFTRFELGGPQSKAPDTFSRAFVSCNVFTESTTMNQQIYGFECVTSSNREAGYQGVQLFLVGKDGNMQNITIAAACCDAPTRENYRWFFQRVEESGVNLRYCPVLCATDAELLGLESELGLTFRYCTRYIIENELAQIGAFNRHHHALVWGLQSSEDEKEYSNRLEWIGTTCGPGVENYLRQFPMERWVVAGNMGKVALYGWRSRNFFESTEQEQEEMVEAGRGRDRGLGLGLGGSSSSAAMSLAAAAIAPNPEAQLQITSAGESVGLGLDRFRNMLPFDFLEAIMATFMQDAYERNVLARKWKKQDRKVTQGAKDLYDMQCRRIGEYKVSRASEFVSFVTNMSKPPSHRRRVDLQSSTCTCAFIDQYAIPCRHLIAVLLFCDLLDTAVDRFAPGYLVDNYALAFLGKSVELPLESSLSEDPACTPPMSALLSRRTKVAADGDDSADPRQRTNKRPAPEAEAVAASAGDEMSNADAEAPSVPPRIRLCKKCRGPGHNVRSCSYQTPIQDQQTI